MKNFLEDISSKEIVKTTVYYCTSRGKIKGTLFLAPELILFEPHPFGLVNPDQYEMCIEASDVCSAQHLERINESGTKQ